MVVKFFAIVVMCFFINGCASSQKHKSQTSDSKNSVVAASNAEAGNTSADEKEIEEEGKKSGFKCLIGKIASGIL